MMMTISIVDGRLALYAKGRVTGKWLMTLAYDTDKEEDETRFQGVIDPRQYYTVYADRSPSSAMTPLRCAGSISNLKARNFMRCSAIMKPASTNRNWPVISAPSTV